MMRQTTILVLLGFSLTGDVGRYGMAASVERQEKQTPVQFTLSPIGWVRQVEGRTTIVLDSKHQPGLLGLDGFSHVYVFWWFDRNDTPEKRAVLQVHPRGNQQNPLTGVFATRSPMRPNLIAMTLCKILSIRDNVVEVEAIDALPDTPVLDLKPYAGGKDLAEPFRAPAWAVNPPPDPSPGPLPTPTFVHAASDPTWIATTVQFHGHLGPWAAAGLRAGFAARRTVQANGYFDVAIIAEGPFVDPPRSCFLDGLQVSTGATWGKRNVQWISKEGILVRLENKNTRAAVEVRPTAKLLDLLAQTPPASKIGAAGASSDAHDGPHAALEEIARTIAKLPETEILNVRVLPPQ